MGGHKPEGGAAEGPRKAGPGTRGCRRGARPPATAHALPGRSPKSELGGKLRPDGSCKEEKRMESARKWEESRGEAS